MSRRPNKPAQPGQAAKPARRSGQRDRASGWGSAKIKSTGFSFPGNGRGTGGYGDRIRDRRAGEPHYRDPEAVFLLYLGFTADHKLIVRQVEGPLSKPGADPTVVERALFDIARTKPHQCQYNFRKMEWKKPCFITMVIDIPVARKAESWDFYWGTDSDHNPIRFRHRKDGDGDGTKIYAENYAFYDGELLPFVGNDGRTYRAFRCRNYVRDEFRDLGTGVKLDYCFEIYLQAPLAHGGLLTMLIDPDGQNQGPPRSYTQVPKRAAQ